MMSDLRKKRYLCLTIDRYMTNNPQLLHHEGYLETNDAGDDVLCRHLVGSHGTDRSNGAS